MSHAIALTPRQRLIIVAVGLFQGALLLGLSLLAEHEIWPMDAPAVRWVAFTLGLALPPLVQFTLGLGRPRQIALALAAGALVLGAMAGYLGTMLATGHGGSEQFRYVVSVLLLLKIALAFVQTALEEGRARFPYRRLFFHAWNNCIAVLLAAIFTGLFWALLLLCGGLFSLIGLAFVERVFTSPYFAMPVTGLIVGIAINLGRANADAVATIRRLLLLVFRALLPMLSLITLVFILTLPITGLEPVWQTGMATSLFLWVVVLNAVFVSAVFNDGAQALPYGRLLRALVAVAVLTLPAYAGLAGYGLYLRVAQYGWSEERVLAAFIAVLVAGYAVSYAWAFVQRPGPSWVPRLAPANRTMALATALLAILSYTPLLNPARVAVASQVERLREDRVKLEDFDFNYLRFYAGRYGEEALAELAQLEDHPDAEQIRKAAADRIAAEDPYSAPRVPERVVPVEEVVRLFPVATGGAAPEPEFLAFLGQNRADGELEPCFAERASCLLLSVDLDGRGSAEYVLIRDDAARWPGGTLPVYGRAKDGWREVTRLLGSGCAACDALGAAREGQVELIAPRWHDLMLGGQRFQISPAVNTGCCQFEPMAPAADE